jgi:hypothetical protein
LVLSPERRKQLLQAACVRPHPSAELCALGQAHLLYALDRAFGAVAAGFLFLTFFLNPEYV